MSRPMPLIRPWQRNIKDSIISSSDLVYFANHVYFSKRRIKPNMRRLLRRHLRMSKPGHAVLEIKANGTLQKVPHRKWVGSGRQYY